MFFTRTLKTALTFCLLLFSTAALSETYYYQSLIDSDNDPATGCTVSVQTPQGVQQFSGADISIVSRVTTSKNADPLLDRQSTAYCNNAAWGQVAQTSLAITLPQNSIEQYAAVTGLATSLRVGFGR